MRELTLKETKAYFSPDDQGRVLMEQLLPSFGINPASRANFRCPNSAAHAHGDKSPSAHYYHDSATIQCYGCDTTYDYVELLALRDGIKDLGYMDKLKHAAEENGIEIVPEGAPHKAYTYTHTHIHIQQNAETEKKEPVRMNLTKQILAAHEQLLRNQDAMNHYTGRGLTPDIIEEYKLGFSSTGFNETLKDYPAAQSTSRKIGLYRYILPYIGSDGEFIYAQAEITDRKEIDAYNAKYRKPKDTPAPLFNERYLTMEQPPRELFIVEGIYDALSVESAGGKAIALGGTAQNRFIEICKKYRPNTRFILLLDTDQPGKDAAAKLAKELDELKLPYIIREPGAEKDANDCMRADQAGFMERISNIIADAEQDYMAEEEAKENLLKEAAEARKDKLDKECAYFSLQDFINGVEGRRDHPNNIPTGFKDVDALLDGGLYPGLYTVGAISSLGKTTFCLQLADQIAQAGDSNILFISLEMGKDDLFSKSLSRISYLESMKETGTITDAKTSRNILNGNISSRLFTRAAAEYGLFADRIWIKEGMGDIGVNNIRQWVQEFTETYGAAPVVIIDYLQILAPYDPRSTDKQNTDKAVVELKRISRDFKTPVICISSFNRDSYTEPVNMSAFKESGAIEYGSDVLLGLQYYGMDKEPNETENKRAARVADMLREQERLGRMGQAQTIELKVLKNRTGTKGQVLLDFVPMFSCYMDAQSVTAAVDPEDGETWQPVTQTHKGRKKSSLLDGFKDIEGGETFDD